MGVMAGLGWERTVMYEKRFRTIAPQAFTSAGTTDGKLTVAKACLFRVGQNVIIEATAQLPLLAQIKRIEPDGITIYVGPCKTNIQTRIDISAYTVIGAATIRLDEQPRTSVPEQEIERLTYEEEPVVARRSFLVDCTGRPFNTENPFPVTVGDGTDQLLINPDGSINVNATVGTSGATYPFTLNVPVPLAGTEYSATLPRETKRFILRMRKASKCYIAYLPGETTTNYVTMNFGVVYAESDLTLAAPLTIYFNSVKAAEVAEIVYWTS